MACSPSIRISKYFGGASIQQEVMTIEEAQSNLKYFWTKEGGSNIVIAVEGQEIKSYEGVGGSGFSRKIRQKCLY